MQTITDHYRPGDRLPSEPELAAAYSVSRSTIREALQALETDGVVRRIHGLGTFVNQTLPRVAGALDVDLGVTETVEAANQRLGVLVLRVEEIAAPREIAERLSLPPAGRVLLIERIILANDRPAALAVDAIPQAIASRAPAGTTRMVRSIASWSASADWCCSAASPTSAPSVPTSGWRGSCDVREGDALLRLEQVERSASEEAVLYSLEHFVPARFDLTISRHRQAGVTR